MTNSSGRGCIFCKIVAGELPAKVICGDEYTIGILDIYPRFGKGQCLAILKKHVEQFYDLDDEDVARLLKGVKEVVSKIEKAFEPDFVATLSRGGGVPHAHFIIFPAWDTPQARDAIERTSVTLGADESFAHIPESELDEIADQIRRA